MHASKKRQRSGIFYEGMEFKKFILDEWVETREDKERWAVHAKNDPEAKKIVVDFHINKEMIARAKLYESDVPLANIVEELPTNLFSTGSKIGDWELVSYISRGNNGEVWSIKQTVNNQPCVIKLITTRHERKHPSCVTEIEAIKALQNTQGCIPLYDSAIYDIKDTSHYCYSVMPEVTLYVDTINANTPLSEIFDIFLQTAKIMYGFREKNVAYGDIKSNHICFLDGQLTLIDYGSCIYPANENEEFFKDNKFTQAYEKVCVTHLVNTLSALIESAGISEALLKPTLSYYLDHKTMTLKEFIDDFSDKMNNSYPYLNPISEKELTAAVDAGLQWMSGGKAIQAGRLAKAIHEIDANFEKAYLLFSLAFLHCGQYETSFVYSNNLINAGKATPQLHCIQGRAHLKMQNYEQAKVSFHKALEIEPTFVPALDQLGTMMLQERMLKREAEARECMNHNAIADFDTKLKKKLLQVFKHPKNIKVISAEDNKLLALGKFGETNDSYETISWDQYFTDLSRGAYRLAFDKEHRGYRPRTWHYLWKNLHVVEKIYAEPRDSLRVLDIGCSSGYLRRFLEGNYSEHAPKDIYYYGVDIRLNNLLRATHDNNDIESGAKGDKIPSVFLQHDLKYELPFHDNQFDVITNFECIKYLPVEQGKTALKECFRVLKSHGLFYLSTTFRSGQDGYIESLDINKMLRILQEIGFETICKLGTQAKTMDILNHLTDEHYLTAKDMLLYYPPDIVATLFAPFYPQFSSQITFVCTKEK